MSWLFTTVLPCVNSYLCYTIYVCMYVCLYVCMYIYLYIYIYIYLYIYVYIEEEEEMLYLTSHNTYISMLNYNFK